MRILTEEDERRVKLGEQALDLLRRMVTAGYLAGKEHGLEAAMLVGAYYGAAPAPNEP